MYLKTAKHSETKIPNALNKDIKKYLRSVKRALYCPREEKKAFMEELEESILLYTSECSDKDIEDIVEKYGSPEKIAQSFLETREPRAVNGALKKNRGLLWALIAVIIAAFLIITIAKVVDFWKNAEYDEGVRVPVYEYKEDGSFRKTH